MAKRRKKKRKTVESLTHEDAARPNIPPAEYQDALDEEMSNPIRVAYERRNPDLDPQLVWRGKEVVNPADLVVPAPPLFIQEKVHPKVLIDDLMRRSRAKKLESAAEGGEQFDLFENFDGLEDEATATEFYKHEANWSNRMILGDSLHVMASLAEREGLRGKVQCIYIDPPYGIKFNSNFQWSTTSRNVQDGKREHITRDPEMVRAFRDTWRAGTHSYLSYLCDRLLVARDLLSVSGSLFMQIGDENVHTVRSVLDEVFGPDNFVSLVTFQKTSGQTAEYLAGVSDYLLWYARDRSQLKYRQPWQAKQLGAEGAGAYSRVQLSNGQRRSLTREERRHLDLPDGAHVFRLDNLTSQRPPGDFPVRFRGKTFRPGRGFWKTHAAGLERLARADRIETTGPRIYYIRRLDDFPVFARSNIWGDTVIAGFASDKAYVVETSTKVVERCVLMASDPGDLVLDPTCGSGTTATVAEQWGRRWITIDTSRVALALARARLMGAKYPWYVLTDSPQGQKKAAQVAGTPLPGRPTSGNLRHGFVCKRVPHIMLKDIANNAAIGVIWERYEETLEPLREQLSAMIGQQWLRAFREENRSELDPSLAIQEWEVPRDLPGGWPKEAHTLHEEFWKNRTQRQSEIDKSIARNAEFEYLYDQPYEDKSKVRVAGPFTVETMSPHREVSLDENDRPMLGQAGETEHADFAKVILEHLKSAGVQQAHKQDKIEFSSLSPWPGKLVCAEGRYKEGSSDTAPQRRAAIFIGPEFGSVMRQDLVDAAEEAADAGFDALISCAFAYGPHAADISELGGLPILKARMNADLHMSKELADTGKGNLFVVFGEPDIEILDVEAEGDEDQIQVRINGVDVFKPQTGKVVSDNRDGIACWMIDTDYNGQSFFVRHAYFLGQNDPYKALKTSLKAEINKEAWATLNRAISRPFSRPRSGRIAVKVINHLGDEVMKVYKV